MTKSIKNIIITGLLLTFSVQAQNGLQKRLNEAAMTVSRGGPVASAQPVVAPKAPVKAVSVTLKPETPSFFTKLSNAASWCSQKLTSIGNGVQKTSAAVYDNRYLFGTAAVVTLWQLNKQRIRNNIRAKIERLDIAPADKFEAQQDFNWATWRKYQRVSNAINNQVPEVYSSPADINDSDRQQVLEQINVDIALNKNYAFLFNGNIRINSLKTTINNDFDNFKLGYLRTAIDREKTNLKQCLDKLSWELDIYAGLEVSNQNVSSEQQRAKYLLSYANSICTWNWVNGLTAPDYCTVIQDKVMGKLINAIQVFNIGIRSIENLNLLAAQDINQAKEHFVKSVCGYGLLFSKSAARLYFDVAVAYGRLKALELKI